MSVSAAPPTDPEIVNCAAYADGRRVADIDLEAVSDYVAKDGHFVWIGLHEPSEATLKKLQEETKGRAEETSKNRTSMRDGL